MKVKEFIQHLQQVPQDEELVLHDDEQDYYVSCTNPVWKTLTGQRVYINNKETPKTRVLVIPREPYT